MPVTAGSIVADRYTLERELGRGATATVWLARDGDTGDHVAVKMLHPELAEGTGRAQFAREAKRHAQLHHDRLVPLLDAGETGETLFMVQPCMPGGTLRQRLLDEKQLSLEATLRLGREVAEALAYLHAQGFVHRDVKPENILFSEGQAYLGDLGILQAIEASVDETTFSRLLVRGTLPYMSPEQASGERTYDGRSDLFSLGSVLYECLAGVPAFHAATADAVLAQVIAGEPRDLRAYVRDVPESMLGVIAKCHAKRPAERFASAAEVDEALGLVDRRRRTPEAGPVVPVPPPVVVPAPTPEPRPAPVPPPVHRRALLGAALALIVVAAAWVKSSGAGASATAAVAADTMRFALFPLVADGEADALGNGRMLREGFERVEEIAVVPSIAIADRLAQDPAPRSVRQHDRIAREFGAGRHVHGRLVSTGGRVRAFLALRDPYRRATLFETELEIPDDPARAERAWQLLALRLLLRTDAVPPTDSAGPLGRSIAARAAMIRGEEALRSWDLARADSFLVQAQVLEPDDAGILYLLAQVRAWSRAPASQWAPLATRAAAAAEGLPSREARLAAALALLGEKRYPEACSAYGDFVRQDSTDFAGWYGLAQCQRLDNLVVKDAAAPSGWRFRASHAAAQRAMERALHLLPTIHRGIEHEGFNVAGIYMLRETELRIGVTATGERFAARLGIVGDSLLLVPVTLATLAASGAFAVPPRFGEAIARQRASFRAQAQDWSTVFPRSIEAKEAVAIAMELGGMPAALDTVRLARRIAAEDGAAGAQGRLATLEARLALRFGLPDDPALLQRVRVLADSLIAETLAGRLAPTEAVEALAVLRGRCDAAVRLASGRSGENVIDIPEGRTVESREVLSRAVMRCDPLSDERRVQALLENLEDEPAMRDARQRGELLALLVLRPALMALRWQPDVVARLARDVDDPLLHGVRAVLGRDTAQLRQALGRWEAKGADASPDLSFVAARLYVEQGDTARATALLDAVLRRLRTADPFVLREPGNVGGLVRAAALRAQLAIAANDQPTARRWQAAIAVLQQPVGRAVTP